MGTRNYSSVWQAGLRGAGIALLANLTIYTLGRVTAGNFVIPGRTAAEASRHVGLIEVIGVTLFTLLMGTLAMLLVADRTGGRRVVLVGAAIFAIISSTAPLSMAGFPTGAFLALMHLATGAAFILTVGRVRVEKTSSTGLQEESSSDPQLPKSA